MTILYAFCLVAVSYNMTRSPFKPFGKIAPVKLSVGLFQEVSYGFNYKTDITVSGIFGMMEKISLLYQYFILLHIACN